jgi:hypothetical protein
MSAAGYQLPAGTYRKLLVENRTTKLLMDDLHPALRELGELRRRLPEDDVEVARLRHAIQQAAKQTRVEIAEITTDHASAVGRPIVALAWQVQAACQGHRLADAPSWLTSSARGTVRVFADDTCEPASQ